MLYFEARSSASSAKTLKLATILVMASDDELWDALEEDEVALNAGF